VNQLIEEIRDLTDAIHALAESNRQVVDLLLAQHADDDGDAPADTYLDGTPMP